MLERQQDFSRAFAIGGNERKNGTGILRDLAHRVGATGTFYIIPLASDERQDYFDMYQQPLLGLVREEQIVGLHDSSQVIAASKSASHNTVFFMSGGSQFKLEENLGDDGKQALQAAADNGALVGGTSAGASALAEQTFGVPNSQIETAGGVHIIKGSVYVDTHFSERGREDRLLRMVIDLAANSEAHMGIGIGIDENTAVFFNENGDINVRGSGGVHLVRCSFSGVHCNQVTIEHASFAQGDQFSLPCIL